LSKTRIATLPINYFIHTTNFKTAEFEKAVTILFIGSLSTGNRLTETEVPIKLRQVLSCFPKKENSSHVGTKQVSRIYHCRPHPERPPTETNALVNQQA